MTRNILLAATVLTGGALGGPLGKPLGGEAFAQPVSGIYIGGGVGANFEQRETLQQTTQFGVRRAARESYGHDTGGAAVASAGYGFGNGLRVELEGNYRYNRIGRAPGSISSGGREQKYGPMVNVLFDLDIGSPYVFPYIGGGAGYQWVDRRRATTGNLALPTSTGGVFNTFGTSVSSGVDSSFAYQAIAGLSFPIPPVVGLSLTAEYRFFALDGDRNFSNVSSGGGATVRSRFKVTDDYNHSLMLGLRYAFNVAPPAVAPVPAPVVNQVSRTYLVFFDWDRADLTDRARQIVAQAAQATTQLQVTRIEVSGHTDTSGTAAYNQGLSVRRAESVAAELVRLGVPRAAITTQGFGFSRPLVATGPGVREPQNRRVEIVLR